MKKAGLIVLLIVIAALVIWQVWRPAMTVEVLRPQTTTLRAYVEEQAVTELPHDYLVSMPIDGWLERIDLREGDAVRADETVARLETDDLQDRARQAEQRIAVLETKLREIADHRLEENALIETRATVKALDETVQAAEAKLEAALAVVEFTQSEVERLRPLLETGGAAAREVREAETEWRKARAEYQGDLLQLAALKTVNRISYIGPKFIEDYIDRKSFQTQTQEKLLTEAQAELEIANRNLARAEVCCPIDGVVLARHQTRRQFLPAGTPLLTVGRLEEMEVVAEILTERATQLTPGDPVEIYGRAVGDKPLSGHVLRVYPAGFTKISSLGVEQQRVEVAVSLDERPPALGIGFRVHVRIFYDEAADALTLPRTALFRGPQGEWQVMIVQDGHTVLRTVTVGLTNDEFAQISEGLSATDLIVAHPAREIVAGLRVRTTGGE
ncbi:MAG: efflux RND transporter periplasmic adaptor subunit [Phycisphaerae bacterium]|jgi:HlyD family secretion protein